MQILINSGSMIIVQYYKIQSILVKKVLLQQAQRLEPIQNHSHKHYNQCEYRYQTLHAIIHF